MCICTDDEGVSRSNLTMEYVKAVERYGLNYSTLKRLSRNCLEYAFIPGESLYQNHDFNQLPKDFSGLRETSWQPGEAAALAMSSNPKLSRQVLLERAFISFEHSLANGFREEQQ